MQLTTIVFILLCSFCCHAQVDLKKRFKKCSVGGSITIYDYKNQNWILSDAADAKKETQPASTFKVINLLIALETGVIENENEVVKWLGTTDTILYGYRPEIYKDMSVKKAFEVSAGWVFIELAKKVGREKYLYYLQLCGYGNLDLSEKGVDFWNFGAFGISPLNQVHFLIKVYENKLPFSKKNIQILKDVMVTEKANKYVLRSKTGWTRVDDFDMGWWIGYIERSDNVYFFANRISKKRIIVNPGFGECRKTITKAVLKQLNAIE